MRKRRLMAMFVMAAMVMVSVVGCGDTGGDMSAVSAKRVSTDENVGDSIIKTGSAASRGFETVTTAAISTDEEATGEAVGTIAQAEVSSDPVEPTSSNSDSGGSDSGGSTASKPKTDSSGSSGSKPKSDSSGSGGAASSKPKSSGSTPSTTAPSTTVPSTTAPPPAPVHVHSWKEHVVTEQVWVPNIVVVDDYEDQVVDMSYRQCDCGMIFDIEDKEGLREHMETSVMAAVQNGTIDSCVCGGYMIHEQYEIQRVKVGSHEEDQGHYEDRSRVDYYYCDCGARQ